LTAEAVFHNSVVGGNTAGGGLGDSCFTYDAGFGLGTFTSLGHNLEDGDACNLHAVGDLVNTDPLLAPLGNYGGPTQTHALLAGSPAVDAGGMVAPAGDQRGMPRPQGPAPDIGAFEAQAMYVQAIGLQALTLPGGGYLVFAGVRIRGQEGGPVRQAMVDAAWTLPDGSVRYQQQIANALGLARFRVLSLQSGTYQLCVDGVARDGYAYDPDQNFETCDTIQVP
jgi:hypothetical protein